MERKSHIYSFLLIVSPLLVFSSLSSCHPIAVYSIVYVAVSLLFILWCRFLLSHEISSRLVFGLIIAGIVLRLAMIPIHPVGSDDYYRYIWDGKVYANGINPYRYAPADKALTALHSQALPGRISFADMKTIYPPLAETLFFFAYKISGESFLGLKLLLFISDLITMVGLYLIVRRLNLDSKNILLYALCPLPLFQFFIDGHLDGFGIPLLVFGIFCYLKDKKLTSYLLIGLSICIKPVALILIPILFFSEKKLAERLKVILVPMIVCCLLYLPFIFSGSPFQALITFTKNWTFNGIIFDSLNILFLDNQRTRGLCAVLFLICYFPIVLSRKDFLTKVYLSIFLLMIFSPVVHPWYLSWLAVLLPVRPRWSGIVFLGLVSLTSYTLIRYQLTGVWKDYPAVLLLEYIPVLTIFFYELATSWRFESQQS